jgi:hypothetical protein
MSVGDTGAVVALGPHAQLAVPPHAVDEYLYVGALVRAVDAVLHRVTLGVAAHSELEPSGTERWPN